MHVDAMGNSAFLILVFNVPSSQEIIVLGEELPRFRGLLGPPAVPGAWGCWDPLAMVMVILLFTPLPSLLFSA